MDNNKGEIMTIRTEELKIILDAASDMYSYNNEFDVSRFVVVAIESVSDANEKTVVDCAVDDAGLEGSMVLGEAEDKCFEKDQDKRLYYFECRKDEWGPGSIVFKRKPCGKGKDVLISAISDGLAIKIRDMLNRYVIKDSCL